jgi:tellurite methyltransferase
LNGQKHKAHWDSKYAQGLPSLTEPDPFFIFAYERFGEPSFPAAGAALDLACGLGRHALWLASRGWRVCGVDLSEVAIRKLTHTALELNVSLDACVGDASEYKCGSARFDLIVLFYHTDHNLVPKVVSALNPGGLLICKLSLRWDTDARLTAVATDPLNRNELLSLFPELHVLYHQERQVRDRGSSSLQGGSKARKCEIRLRFCFRSVRNMTETTRTH